MERRHIAGRDGCPGLPAVEGVWTAREMAGFRGRHDGEFFVAALGFAQSLWLEGKPAQALLQMNKAMMADLGGSAASPESLDGGGPTGWPLPYAAKVWVMRQTGADEFLGNPVRHYQHLATRMSGVRAELRSWREWACFCLAERLLEAGEHPRDEEQIAREHLVVPGWEEVRNRLDELGLRGEGTLVDELMISLAG